MRGALFLVPETAGVGFEDADVDVAVGLPVSAGAGEFDESDVDDHKRRIGGGVNACEEKVDWPGTPKLAYTISGSAGSRSTESEVGSVLQ